MSGKRLQNLAINVCGPNGQKCNLAWGDLPKAHMNLAQLQVSRMELFCVCVFLLNVFRF